jgi:small-conductance mechanosensitive channel
MPLYRSGTARGAFLLIFLVCCVGGSRAAAPGKTASATGPAATTGAPAGPATTPAAPSAAVPAAAAAPPFKPPLTAEEVITVLDQTVDWYRTLGIQQKAATEPSDLLILYDNRQTAEKVMSLAFAIARADADMLGKAPLAAGDTSAAGFSSQALDQIRTKLDAQAASVQAELAVARAQIGASKKSRIEVRAKINELQGVLDLVATKQSILADMAGFTSGSATDNSSAGALKAQIDAMAVALPADGATSATTAAPANTSASVARNLPGLLALMPSFAAAAGGPTVERFGLWDLASNAFHLSEKRGTIQAIDQRTAALQATLSKIREPLLTEIKALSARGDALAARADSADSNTLNGVHDQLDALAGQFKQVSSLLIPLSRESILLTQYRRNLGNWRENIKTQYQNALKTLAVGVGILLVVLGLLFGAAEIWKRTVLRYIQDARRRYQLLLLRRIALWALIVVIIGIAFASELGSIATFAGLITAGVAVAMQSVLVSIVGYFFLIGKYGIRVGDRVQIGDVAGEVIDLGLVRMYLMELGAKGASGPTGRVVAFANSVVFQVASGLFKQIPGVSLSWREVTLNLPPAADPAAMKARLLAALTKALEAYRPEILRQTQELERATFSGSVGDVQPQVQLRFTVTGIEAHVRYPVHWQHAAETDERVTEALTHVVSGPVSAPAGVNTPGSGG